MTLTSHHPSVLPPGLPVPQDDGACLHLRGRRLPDIALPSTQGRPVPLDRLDDGPAVLFFYPRTGIPGQPPSLGYHGETWESIPGARGCTPQSCGFRDLHDRFAALGVRVFGVSTNSPEHQGEFKGRHHVPFEFLSDADLRLTRSLNLPTFEFPVESGGPTTLLRRMAWYLEPDGAGRQRIVRAWYPVFPADRNAIEVLGWLERRAGIALEPVSSANADFVRRQLVEHWMSTTIVSLGVAYQADRLGGFVARVDGQPRGHLTYIASERGLEVITVAASRDDAGIGTRLLDAAESHARSIGATRLFLTTTNDNLRALRFYQRRGMRMVAVHRGMMDRYRAEHKPIPWIGLNGIPLRDEIEMECLLED